MKRSSVSHLDHGLAHALDIVGEWWSPLIVRCVMKGSCRFEAMQQELGIARNILSDRLSTLVEAGVLKKEKYQDRPARYEYQLTEMGADLYPVLLSLKAWGDRWVLNGQPKPRILHIPCNEELVPATVCSCCNKPVLFDETSIIETP
jgi:DNA-binding HxlR family transcriptional regulator